MNFTWKEVVSRGQSATGFIDVLELENKGKAIAIIHYLSQHTHTEPRIIFTLILEGNKINWTTGIIASIFEDIENKILLKTSRNLTTFNSLEYLDTQIFTVSNIDDFDYLSHGDSSFTK